jgi:hypothetical protein
MHSLVLAGTSVFTIVRWSGLTFRGITVLLIAFSIHAAGIVGIVKRLKWGYSFSKTVFGFYMITSGLGLLGSLARQSDVMITAEKVFLFTVFTWLFLRFRSTPSVRAYFER